MGLTYKKKGNLVTRDIAGETLIVPVSGDLADLQKIFALDEVGAYIWEHLNGNQDADEICDGIVEEFDVSRETARADLEAFVQELVDAGLAESV